MVYIFNQCLFVNKDYPIFILPLVMLMPLTVLVFVFTDYIFDPLVMHDLNCLFVWCATEFAGLYSHWHYGSGPREETNWSLKTL